MPRNTRADETILHPASSRGVSLRTTIPAFIISSFELNKGDMFRWSIDGEQLVINIQKGETTGKDWSKQQKDIHPK